MRSRGPRSRRSSASIRTPSTSRSTGPDLRRAAPPPSVPGRPPPPRPRSGRRRRCATAPGPIGVLIEQNQNSGYPQRAAAADWTPVIRRSSAHLQGSHSHASVRSSHTSDRHDRRRGAARGRQPRAGRARRHARPVRCRPRVRFLGVHPQGRREPNRFATALDAIANRVDETTADLTASDATMSFVQFASSAADDPGCVNLKLLDSPETVAKFADCLRSVAAAYRKGLDPALARKIGVDTNYVAAMERAATHIPPDVEAAGDDPVHRRKARRQGRSRQRRSNPLATACSGHGRRSRCCRSGWVSTRRSAGRSTAGLAGAAHHPGYAGMHQRSDVRVADGRLRHTGQGRQRGRAGAPGRDLHVHGRADAGADPATDPGRGPGGSRLTHRSTAGSS